MAGKSYTLEADEKASLVMIGTPDVLIWGDLVTKEAVRMSTFLVTVAQDFVPVRDVKALFLAPVDQTPPVERHTLHVKQEEILMFFEMSASEPLPEETQTRQYAPVEVFVGSFQIKGKLLKSPMATIENTLQVTRAVYIPIYEATIRHIAKPWLGSFSADIVQVRRERMLLAEP
jgi:hypothetical protein